MAEKSIATQSQLNSIFFAMSELADNLSAHANASLGYAHGFNVLYPINFTDKYGNSVTSYTDSNADVVGTYIVNFTSNGVRYFCPAKATFLSGQPPMEGLPPSVLANMLQVSGAGSSNWITDFSVGLATYVGLMNQLYLIPHARLGYWEAHRGITAFDSRIWLDSAGHTVGTASIRIPVGGIVYEIPAKTSLQGVVTPWMGYEFAADRLGATGDKLTWNHNMYGHTENDGQNGFFYLTERNASGTLPRGLRLLINTDRHGTNPSWYVIPPVADDVILSYRKLSTFFSLSDLVLANFKLFTYHEFPKTSPLATPYLFKFADDTATDQLHPVATMRIMAIAYVDGTAAEKRYSFGNLVMYLTAHTSGKFSIALGFENPFSSTWTGGDSVPAYDIGETVADAVSLSDLIWVSGDPLQP